MTSKRKENNINSSKNNKSGNEQPNWFRFVANNIFYSIVGFMYVCERVSECAESITQNVYATKQIIGNISMPIATQWYALNLTKYW